MSLSFGRYHFQIWRQTYLLLDGESHDDLLARRAAAAVGAVAVAAAVAPVLAAVLGDALAALGRQDLIHFRFTSLLISSSDSPKLFSETRNYKKNH